MARRNQYIVTPYRTWLFDEYDFYYLVKDDTYIRYITCEGRWSVMTAYIGDPSLGKGQKWGLRIERYSED